MNLPAHYVLAELVDAAHKLPMPNGRLFGANPDHPGKEHVNPFDMFVAMLFAGGSIRKAAPAPVEQDEPSIA